MDYGKPLHPLTIEVFYRNRNIDLHRGFEGWTKINESNVYTIDALCENESIAPSGLDKIRDLYDLYSSAITLREVVFIQSEQRSEMPCLIKGIEQFDYSCGNSDGSFKDKDKISGWFSEDAQKIRASHRSDSGF